VSEEDLAVDDSVSAVGAPAGRSPVRPILIAGLAAVIALTGVCGWLGYRTYQERQAEQLRQLLLQVGRRHFTLPVPPHGWHFTLTVPSPT
jgi:Mce-associated membrane protein